MKFNMKFLAAAVALAATGQASAAITQGSAPGGSSLFLSVWDTTTNESYTRNLGLNLNSFLPSSVTTLPNDGTIVGTPVTGDKTPAAGINLAFAGDSLFTSTFGDNLAANIQWNIVAFDSVSSLGGGLARVLTTANGAPNTNQAGINLITPGGTNYLSTLLTLGLDTANSVVVTDVGSVGFAGNASWGDALNGGLNGSSAGTGFGSTLDFFYLARTTVSGSASALATNVQYGNAFGTATFSLSADGTATYNLAGDAAPSAVPVPAAAWLMGSGLLGMLGAARRRKAAKVVQA